MSKTAKKPTLTKQDLADVSRVIQAYASKTHCWLDTEGNISMAEMASADAHDTLVVVALIEEGKIKEAAHNLHYMDSNPREAFPQRIYDKLKPFMPPTTCAMLGCKKYTVNSL